MATLWFVLLTFMLCMYAILDGFDLGVGTLHLILAKTDDERRSVLSTIAPVWDGNEVWLIAAGGTMFFAFPVLYASSFSGFYLPLVIVLWLLMLRGLGIEFRHQVHHAMWRSFWDSVFSMSSLLLTIVLGAALGNVVRGVPLGKDGYFFEPLWTTFTVVPEAGILDWFTLLMGGVACSTLAVHGACFLAMKTGGELHERARALAARLWWAELLTSLGALLAVSAIRPAIWENYSYSPWGFIFPLGGAIGLAGTYLCNRLNKNRGAFLSSSLFILSMLASTAFGLYPAVLPSTLDPEATLTIYNAAAHSSALSIGLTWWVAGMVAVAGYFVYIYRSFRGKVTVDGGDSRY
ncbi:MAG TPA: cytochrome d ubiquinol oxidase subunit II [Bacteroidota bacterium]|nr:cytochrome d ubiquinol oxidase subunit II [Bacteroidota bacterium]